MFVVFPVVQVNALGRGPCKHGHAIWLGGFSSL